MMCMADSTLVAAGDDDGFVLVFPCDEITPIISLFRFGGLGRDAGRSLSVDDEVYGCA